MHQIRHCCTSFFSQVRLERHPAAVLRCCPSRQHRLDQSVGGLRDSAAAGCHFCSPIHHSSLTAAGWFDGDDDKGVYVVDSCFEGVGEGARGGLASAMPSSSRG